MSKGDSSILDRRILETMLAGIGEETTPILLNSLKQEFTQTHTMIIDAINAHSTDWHMIEVKSHALKSAAASFGAMRLSAVCLDMEKNAREVQDNTLLETQCAALTDVIMQTRGAFGWK